MSKFNETVTVDHAVITCDHCGKRIEGYDGIDELSKDAIMSGWEFCIENDDNTIEPLLGLDNYDKADLQFCCMKCMHEWLVDSDTNYALKQDGHGGL